MMGPQSCDVCADPCPEESCESSPSSNGKLANAANNYNQSNHDDVEERQMLSLSKLSSDKDCKNLSDNGSDGSSSMSSFDAMWAEDRVDVHYGVTDSPPIYMCLLLGFQHYISMFLATLTVPFLLSPAICMDKDDVGKSELTGTLFVASGIITLLQTLFGCRLPVVQGGTFAVLVPTLSYLSLPQWECPSNIVSHDEIGNLSLAHNKTEYILAASSEHKELWQTRLRMIQGSIMCAAVFEVILGASGLVGIFLRYIGPLCICPTVTMLGLSLFRAAAKFAEGQWWICLTCIVLMVLFSQYLGVLNIPCFCYTRQKGCFSTKYQLFKMFPILLAVLISWILCLILTETGVLPNNSDEWGYKARTDLHNNAFMNSPWFRVPYPLQWGTPTASVSCVFAILSGILATTIESVGDYHACAKLAGAPPPPLHAVNRGIMVEGLGSIIDGLMGTGNGTTSTSINVGVVGLTKVGSRRVVQVSALFMIVFGIFTKFGALFITIPDPIIGATFFILFGMIVAVGISNLQYVDMNSGRNLFIIGFSLLMGLAIPQWVGENKEKIHTGVLTIDNILQVLLSTGMFVGGTLGFFLDNTIPGTDKERGLSNWKQYRQLQTTKSKDFTKLMSKTYDLPFGMSLIKRAKWTRYLPFCPTFGRTTTRESYTGEVTDEDAVNAAKEEMELV